MKIKDTSTPVVVLKLEHYGGLGIIRSLGRLGVSIYGVEKSRTSPALNSRYCRGMFLWDIETQSEEKSVDLLLTIGRDFTTRAILVFTSDETAMFVAKHAKRLKEAYIFPELPLEFVSSLCNKKEMYRLAKKHKIATAETLFPQTRNDVLNFLEYASFPIMLKGINGGMLERRTGKKMIIVRHKVDLLEKYDTMEDEDNPNLMLQEYIPGDDDTVWMFNGYFNSRSECLLGFTGKKIRQNPVHTGMTSLGICLTNETVSQVTKAFMKAIGYRGILDIGYRYDARDGQYKVLDINPRIGATFRLFVGRNGMDMIRACYLDLTNQEVPADTLNVGRKWFVEDKDLRSSYDYFKTGKLTMREWISSFRDVREAGYFSKDDLKPFFRMWLNHILRTLTMLYTIVRFSGRAKKFRESSEVHPQTLSSKEISYS